MAQLRHGGRLVALLVLAIVVLCFAAARVDAASNVVLLQSDDWGWPYYGFMQRYLREKANRRCDPINSINENPCQGNIDCGSGGTCGLNSRTESRCTPTPTNSNHSACTTSVDCPPGSTCVPYDTLLLGAVGAASSAKEYLDPELTLPDDNCSTQTRCTNCTVGVCSGGTKNGQACHTTPECTGGGTCIPSSRCTPPVHELLTPAMDSLAEDEGNYFPTAHLAASICKPSVTSIMTGLYIGDMVLTGQSPETTVSPVLPEWLPGFEFGNFNDSGTYVTMCAGKCTYGEPHVQPGSSPPLQPKPRASFDRKMPDTVNAGDNTHRAAITPYFSGSVENVPDSQKEAMGKEGRALERVKDFITCARCLQTCKGGSKHDRTCSTDDDCKCHVGEPLCVTDGRCFHATTVPALPPGVCGSPTSACTACGDPPQSAPADDDSTRLHDRNNAACAARPFHVTVAPFIPHLQFRPDDYCPFFLRDEFQCAREPWRSNSVYCRWNAAFDADGVDGPEGHPDGRPDAGEYRTCAYVTDKLNLLPQNLDYDGRTSDANYYNDDNKKYLRFINAFDRAVDELVAYLKCPRRIPDTDPVNPPAPDDEGLICDPSINLFKETAILYTTDNGFGPKGSKGNFREDGHRTPFIMHLPGEDQEDWSLDPTCGPDLNGCRSEFAHSVDLLKTIKVFAGELTNVCPAPGTQGLPMCPTASACCCPTPSSCGVRYSEGRDLSAPSRRPCDPPAGVSPDSFHQCIIGRRQDGGQTITPANAFYVLAEVEEPAVGTNPRVLHSCKYYRQGDTCGNKDLFDVKLDPNEKKNLNGVAHAKCVGGPRDNQDCDYTPGPNPGCDGGYCNYCKTHQANLDKILRKHVVDNGWMTCTSTQWP